MRASDWPGLARISPFEETIDDLTSAFDHILEVRASGWLRQPRLIDESIWYLFPPIFALIWKMSWKMKDLVSQIHFSSESSPLGNF